MNDLDDVEIDPPEPPQEPDLPRTTQPAQPALPPSPPPVAPGTQPKVTVQYNTNAPFQAPAPRAPGAVAQERLVKVKEHLAEWSENPNYQNYRVEIHKSSPFLFKGSRVLTGHVIQNRPISPWPDIEEEVRSAYGGGSYQIQIYSEAGSVVSAANFTIPLGEHKPRLHGEEAPRPEGGAVPTDPIALKQQAMALKRLEMEEERIEQERETRRAEAEAKREALQERKADMNKQGDFLTQFLERQRLADEREATRRDEERKERERERKEELLRYERERKEELQRREEERREDREREERRMAAERESRSALLTALTTALPTLLTVLRPSDDKTLEIAKIQADAQRSASEVQAKSNERIMDIVYNHKKDDSKNDERLWSLMEKSIVNKDRGGMREMMENMRAFSQMREIFSREDGGPIEMDPEQPAWMNILNVVGAWLQNSPIGQAAAAKVLGVGPHSPAQIQQAAQVIAPQFVQAAQQQPQAALGEPVIHMLPDPNQAQATPPLVTANPPAAAAPAADPNAALRLRETLNQVMTAMITDLRDGVRDHSWVGIALGSLPSTFLDQLCAAPNDDARLQLIQANADPALVQEVVNVAMSKLGALQNLGANFNRLREEHLGINPNGE